MEISENKQFDMGKIFQAIDIICNYCHYASPFRCHQCPVNWINDDLSKN